MAISLNGSSQYIGLGNGVNVQGARPITLAALINTASLRTSGSWNGIYSQGDYDTRGWGVEIEAAASPRVYHTWVDAIGTHENYSSFNVGANTGWWLIMVVHRDAGASSAVNFWGYRYNTSALSNGTAGGGGTNDADPTAPGGSDPTVVGAFIDVGAVIDHYPNPFGWAGIWNADLGEANAANPKALWELIVRGPWGMLDSTCKFFQPFSNAAQDLSGNARHGTLNGSPSYAGSGPTEFAPSLWIVPDFLTGGSDLSLDAPVAFVAVTGELAAPTLAIATPSTQTATDSRTASPSAQISTPLAAASGAGYVSNTSSLLSLDAPAIHSASAVALALVSVGLSAPSAEALSAGLLPELQAALATPASHASGEGRVAGVSTVETLTLNVPTAFGVGGALSASVSAGLTTPNAHSAGVGSMAGTNASLTTPSAAGSGAGYASGTSISVTTPGAAVAADGRAGVASFGFDAPASAISGGGLFAQPTISVATPTAQASGYGLAASVSTAETLTLVTPAAHAAGLGYVAGPALAIATPGVPGVGGAASVVIGVSLNAPNAHGLGEGRASGTSIALSSPVSGGVGLAPAASISTDEVGAFLVLLAGAITGAGPGAAASGQTTHGTISGRRPKAHPYAED